MADHDEEALLQEELDLDYEVDDELAEEELLAENDDFDLENETYNVEQGTGEDGDNEAHTTQEQEEDILDLGVTDTGIDDLDEEGFQNNQGGDEGMDEKKERDRFHSERANTSGHTPIVFDGTNNENEAVAVIPKAQKYIQKFQRLINSTNFRGRGGRGNFRPNNRGSFHNVNNNHNRTGFVHSRLGQRQGTVNIQNINKHPHLESNKVLINPHFRGNVQPSRDARLVWDTQVQQTQQYQQTYQNLGNFSQPIMQQPQQHHQHPPPQQMQLTPNVLQNNWNNPPQQQHQNFPHPAEGGHYNHHHQPGMPMPVVTVQNVPPPQQDMMRMNVQSQMQQFDQPKLGPMFVNNNPAIQHPQHQPLMGQQNYDTPIQNDWYNNTDNEPVNVSSYGSQSEHHFKIPTQCGFRGRGVGNRGGGRIMTHHHNNNILRTIPTEPEYIRPARNQDRFNQFPRSFQQNSESFLEHYDNQQINMPQHNSYNQPQIAPPYNQPPQFQNQQQFNHHQPMYPQNEPQHFPPNHYNHPPENVPYPQPTVQIHQNQQIIPPLNLGMNQGPPQLQFPRRVVHNKRPLNENQPLIRRPFHNQNRSPQKRNIALHSNEIIPKKKKSLDFRNLQEVPRVDVPDTTVFFEDKHPTSINEIIEEEDEETRAYRLKIEEQRKLREQIIKQKEERRKKAAAQATSGSEVSTTTGNVSTITKVQNTAQRKIIKPLERKIMQSGKIIPNKNRLIVLTANQQKEQNSQAALVRPVNKLINRNPNLVKIENKQIMPNTVSSTQAIKKPLIITKRVVRTIPRQPAVATSQTSETSESEEVIDKEHLSAFLSTRTVVPKAPVNGTIISANKTLLKTNVVQISNLSASTSELKIRKLCKGVGLIQNIQMSPNIGQAIIRFKNIAHAHNFYKKYQRKMVDLSLIDVTLIPGS